MKAILKPCTLHGAISAPPSKSMAHRYLIGAALSGKACTLSGIEYSEDIFATIDCLSALGTEVTVDGDCVFVYAPQFLKGKPSLLPCRESGSTLRFFLPLALTLGIPVTLTGSQKLLSRPLGLYETLCRERGFSFEKNADSVTVCGTLSGGEYTLSGGVSSQFITGLIFALVFKNEGGKIRITPPFESRSYVLLTLSALRAFGANVAFTDENTIEIKPSSLGGFSGKIEGDYSNAAFLDAFNFLGGDVVVSGLDEDSLQGDRIYKEYFKKIRSGTPTLDISDCPDLAPVLIALSAMHNGATLINTDRLIAKESDRGEAMHLELQKLGGGLIFGENQITVPKQHLIYKDTVLCSHNDHRIVMALSVILSKTGGEIEGAEAVKKSYPRFFKDIKSLNAKVEIK